MILPTRSDATYQTQSTCVSRRCVSSDSESGDEEGEDVVWDVGVVAEWVEVME